MTDYLFVYGTLLRDAAPVSLLPLTKRLRRVGTASVAGDLYDFGTYPGIVLEGSGGTVQGEIVNVGSASAWLRLDTYEGFDSAQPELSLFRRVRCIATSETGAQVGCWIYVYNRDISDADLIESGCWRSHLFDGDVVTVAT